MRLSATDRRRVADAVAAAETSTRGEIRCVEIPKPSFLTVASVAALVAVFVPVLLVLAGWRPNELGRTGGWTVIDPAPLEALRLYVGLQAVVFSKPFNTCTKCLLVIPVSIFLAMNASPVLTKTTLSKPSDKTASSGNQFAERSPAKMVAFTWLPIGIL